MFKAQLLQPGAKDNQDFKALYFEAFPPYERMPFWWLMRRNRLPKVDIYKFYDDDEFVGFTYNVCAEVLVHVVYLAVSSQVRSKGYGSKILAKLHDLYPQMLITLECEDARQPAENSAERRRRRAFYIKNGYEPCGLKTREGKVTYEMMAKGGSYSKEQHCEVFRYLYGAILYLFLRPQFIE